MADKPDSGGRGAVTYLDMPVDDKPTKLVLRHYQRGGLVAKLTRTKYLWHGLAKTRAATELGLLDHLCQQQLPVCKPFAAQVLRRGLNYECSLLTHELTGATTMGSLLQSDSLTVEQWPLIGKLIRQMHELQVYHADLNAHNIMLAGNKAYLIDFDRGEQRSSGGDAWKAANLQRLHRSIVKLQRKYGFSFETAQWQALQSAYSADAL